MPRLPGAEVTLLVDGEPLPEYRVVTNGVHEVSCYVPSVTGKQFKISLKDRGPEKGPDVYIHSRADIDGVDLNVGDWHPEVGQRRHRLLAGVDNESSTAFKPLYFADLQVSEDGPLLSGSGETKGLGTISLSVLWLRHHDITYLQKRDQNIPVFQNTAVHEKSKKLTTHRVLLGKPVLEDRSHHGRIRTSFDKRYAHLKFCFHYAKKDLLMARDIIPNPQPQLQPTPTPLPKKRLREAQVTEVQDLDDGEEDGTLTREEKQILERLRAKEARSQTKRVKTEVKAEPGLSTFKIIAGGVVDLTDD